MKMKIKKFAAVLLAFVLAFALSVPAFAATGTDAKIKIKNPNSNITIDGKTFYAYKLFDLNYNSTDDAYAYTVNDDFVTFFQSADVLDNSNLTGAALDAAAYEYVSQLTSDSKALLDFAEAAYDWAILQTPAIGPITSEAVSGENVTLNVGDFGYYLVYGEASDEGDNTVVSDFMCVTCKSNEVATAVNLKADAPTVDKDVSTDGSNYNETAVDADLGDTVYFKYESAVPDMYGYDAYTFEFTDTLSKGLTFGDITSVTVGGTEVNSETGYTFTKIDSGDTTTLTLALNNFLNYTKDAAIVVTYTATLNDKAMGTNENSVYLTYSNDPNSTASTNNTPSSTVCVYNYEIPVYKYTGTLDEDAQALAGAKFELSLDGTTLSFFKVTGTDDYYRLAVTGDATTTTELISDTNGNIDIRGLDAGTYILKETKAPEGYNLLTDTITVTITAVTETATGAPTGNCTITSKFTNSEEDASKVTKIAVENTTGVVLPSTGGIGTVMFKIGGSAILLLAGAFLVLNRKKVFGSGK